MTITLGWWLLPAFVSVAGFIAAFLMCHDDHSGGGFLDLSGFFHMVTWLVVFVVPSLIAWLIWSLLK